MNVPSYYVCTEAFGRVDSKGAHSTPLMDSSFAFCVYSVEKRSLASPRGHEQQQHLRWIPGLHLIAIACDLWYIFASIYHYSSLSTCHFTLSSLPSHSSRVFICFSQNFDSCRDEHVRITASKADGPVPNSVQFHLQSEPSCYSRCQEEAQLLCQVTPRWQVKLTRAESKPRRNSNSLQLCGVNSDSRGPPKCSKPLLM